MTTPKITLHRLRELISEEVQSATSTNESVDHKTIGDVVSIASKLLSSVEAFKEKAPTAAINAVTPHLAALEKALENMLQSPGSYVPVPKREPVHLTLTQTKS